jgi:hypothetical protein
MGADVLHVDAAADQSGERRVGLGVAMDIQALVGQITDAGRKAKAQQVHQAEHMVGEPGRVGVVLLDAQVRFVVQQAIQDMGGVAHCGIDDLGVERRVLVGDVGVKLHARFLAVFQVHLTGTVPTAAGLEVLAVRRRRGAIAPVGGERLAKLGIDQFGQPAE